MNDSGQKEVKTIEDYKIWFPYEVFYIESMLTITRTVMAEVSCCNFVVEEIDKGKLENLHSIIDFVQNIIILL
jgi:hypothetical protein